MDKKNNRSLNKNLSYEFEENPFRYFAEEDLEPTKNHLEDGLRRFLKIKENIEKGLFEQVDLHLVQSILTIHRKKFDYPELNGIIDDILLKIELSDISRYA